ncbi:MAG TPA: TIGR00645 family protein [Micropepsaceae bacterium]|nr:TIGR00645 family protein [Micropepsaceae bacterium]
MRAIERVLEKGLFASRWLMAPFYVGLVLALIVLLVVFVHDIVSELPALATLDEASVILWVLTLIDLSLAGNLILMVIFAGYENFVSKMDVAGHPDRPAWMGTIDFSAMKLKLLASIVAISAIQLLKVFMSIGSYSRENIIFFIVIHLTFVGSGVLLALMDYIADKAGEHQH